MQELNRKYKSNLSSPVRNFLIGMGSVLDLAGNCYNKRGQIFAFIIGISYLLAATFLIWEGHNTAGTILGSLALGALVFIFIYGKKEQEMKASKIEV